MREAALTILYDVLEHEHSLGKKPAGSKEEHPNNGSTDTTQSQERVPEAEEFHSMSLSTAYAAISA